MKTYNHPHWSEGSWDEPIITDLPDIDDMLRDRAELTTPADTPEPELPNAVEWIGGLLGDIVGAIGNGLQGIWDFGVGLVSPIIDGVTGLIGSVVNGIGNILGNIFGGIFNWGPKNKLDELPVWSIVEADLEAAMQPHFDKIDENIALSQSLSVEMGEMIEEIGGMNDELGGMRDEIATINSSIIQSIEGELVPINDSLVDLNERLDNLLEPTGELETRLEGLADDLSKEISAGDEEMKEYLEGPAGKLWPIQEAWNNSQSDWNQAITSALDMQKAWNGQTSQFNSKITQTLQMQAAWNNQTTGWMAQQQKINQANADIQQLQRDRDNLQDEMFEEVSEALSVTQEYISRMMPIQGVNTTNDHFTATRSNNVWNITAKGDWVGSFVFHGETRTRLDAGVHAYEPVTGIGEVGGTRSWSFTADQTGGTRNAVIYYNVVKGRLVVQRPTVSRISPSSGVWTTVASTTLPSSLPNTTGNFIFRIGWDAATFIDSYGVRITSSRNGTVATVGPNINLGPLLPIGDGYRTQSVNKFNHSVRGGDTIFFQVYSNAGSSAQRRIRDGSARVEYFDTR